MIIEGTRLTPLKTARIDQFAYSKEIRTGQIEVIKTPWREVNQAYYNGLGWRWIITIGGLSGAGKTAFCVYLMMKIAEINKQEIHQIFFSMEMPTIDIAARTISLDYERSVADFYTGTENALTNKQFNTIMQTDFKMYESGRLDNIYIVDETVNIKQLESIILGYLKQIGVTPHSTKGAGVVFYFDHTLLFESASRYDDAKDTLKRLLQMQNEIKKKFRKVLFFNLSQLNRDIESPLRQSVKPSQLHLHYPKNSDFYGSSACQHYSDCMWVMHNPAKIGIKKYGPHKWDTLDRLFFHETKSRGAKGFYADPMVFDARLLKYNKIELYA